MFNSGLRSLKRNWSAHSIDLENDAGVIATKAETSVQLPHTSNQKPDLAQHQPLKEQGPNKKAKDYDFDQEFEEISYAEFCTPPFKPKHNDDMTKSSDSSAGQSKHGSVSGKNSTDSDCSTKSSEAAIRHHDKLDNKSDSLQQKREIIKNPYEEQGDIKMAKRQLPDLFYKSNLNVEKAPRLPWERSASELRKDAKANLFIKGTINTDKSSSALLQDGPSKPQQQMAKVFLSKEQQAVYDLVVKRGKTLFFTGSAGTGKSVCLREIIKGLKLKYEPNVDSVAVTASTGIAACNIGGITLHSFAGAGLCNEEVDKLVMKVRRNRKTASRWMRTNVLIIDEISMVAPEFLDKLEQMARIIRKSPKPFGGIQVVMTGDFFQLPPVNKSNQPTKYAFDSECWKTMMDEQNQLKLTQVFRQKDPTFVNMLNELRYGQLSAETIKLFSSLEGESELEKTSKMTPTVLFPTRQEVDRANAQQLVKIKKPFKTYDSLDSGTLPPEMLHNVLENFMAPKKLNLKPGCQVMLIKNLDSELVNGTIGTLLAFCTQSEFERSQYCGFDWDSVDPMTMTEESIQESLHEFWYTKRQEERRQLEERRNNLDEFKYTGDEEGFEGEEDFKKPQQNKEGVKAAAAQTMDDLDKAIRRAESRERSRSRSVSPERQQLPVYPVVKFIITGTTQRRFRTKLMTRETWSNEQPNGEITASRSQIPLILSWALSIHKSQGQTLPLVKIDLNKTFEKGQAYVALSRAVSKEGLQVLGFNARKVKVDQRVVQFYHTLATIKS